MADQGPASPDGAWWAGAYRPHTLGPDCWCYTSRGCRMLDWLAGLFTSGDVCHG